MFRSTGKAPVANVDPREYHGAVNAMRGHPGRVMTRSDLWAFGKCPRRWINGEPRKQSAGMAWGSKIDCAVITPELFDKHYAMRPTEYPDDKSKMKPWHGASSWCKEWLEEARENGQEPIDEEEFDEVKKSVARLKSDGDLWPWVSECRKSVLLEAEWVDGDIVVPVKVLLDLDHDEAVADLKTTGDASDEAWCRTVAEYGYHYQAAMYLDVYEAVRGVKKPFRHVISESVPPYEPVGRQLSDEFVAIGRTLYQRDLDRYCECLRSGEWPGYNAGFQLCEPKAWMLV